MGLGWSHDGNEGIDMGLGRVWMEIKELLCGCRYVGTGRDTNEGIDVGLGYGWDGNEGMDVGLS